jgi:hypothetical protein
MKTGENRSLATIAVNGIVLVERLMNVIAGLGGGVVVKKKWSCKETVFVK